MEKILETDNNITFVSIHDAQITYIEDREDCVEFFFDDGYDLIKDKERIHIKNGSIIVPTKAENIWLFLLDKSPSKHGLKVKGGVISIKKLKHYVNKKKFGLEINFELYGYSTVHWRGHLIPLKKKRTKGFFRWIIIETWDCEKLQYVFNEHYIE